MLNHPNRPLALRGHVTNASLKQWVVIMLMPKIDRAHKSHLTPEIWEETHLREIFHGTLIFQQSSMICMGRHVGGYALALQHGGQNYFFLISSKCLIFTFRCAINVTTPSFQHFPWSLSARLRQKMVIYNFKNQVLVTWPATNFLILSKWCGFEKPNYPLFCLRGDPLTVFRLQNHVTLIFIKTLSYDLLVQVAY